MTVNRTPWWWKLTWVWISVGTVLFWTFVIWLGIALHDYLRAHS